MYPTVQIHAQISKNKNARPTDVVLNRRTIRNKAVSVTAEITKAHTPKMVFTEAPLSMQYNRDTPVAQLCEMDMIKVTKGSQTIIIRKIFTTCHLTKIYQVTI
jgi:hypothetical protein